jgi:hypothetical protein
MADLAITGELRRRILPDAAGLRPSAAARRPRATRAV